MPLLRTATDAERVGFMIPGASAGVSRQEVGLVLAEVDNEAIVICPENAAEDVASALGLSCPCEECPKVAIFRVDHRPRSLQRIGASS